MDACHVGGKHRSAKSVANHADEMISEIIAAGAAKTGLAVAVALVYIPQANRIPVSSIKMLYVFNTLAPIGLLLT